MLALFLPDPLSARATAAIAAHQASLAVSDYTELEFSAAAMRLARAGIATRRDAREALAEFDTWRCVHCERPETAAGDVLTAAMLARREDLALRGSDALHVAIVMRIGGRLLTFDKKLASNAKRAGVNVMSA